MNAAQRRRAFRALKREWPIGTLVRHPYGSGDYRVAGYTRDLMTVDVQVADGNRDFPFGYCLRRDEIHHAPSRFFFVPIEALGAVALSPTARSVE